MEDMIKNLVKEAVIEALAEVMNQDVAVMYTDEDESSDGKKKPSRPKPLTGPSGFSLR